MKQLIISAFILFCSTCMAETYYSQCGQDKFVNENYFTDFKTGIFVEIGAHNGITLSNTYFFEQKRWKGICIEPIPEIFAELKKNRNCNCIEGCIADKEGVNRFLRISSPFVHTEMLSGLVDKYDPRHTQRILSEISHYGGSYKLIDVNCYLLNDILKENDITHINYLSIDTQGNEFEILSSIDFDKVKIDVITIEDNYRDPRFTPFLEERGFKFVKRLDWDLLFVNENFVSFKG